MNAAFAQAVEGAPAIDVGSEAATGGLEWLIVGAIVLAAVILLTRQFVSRRRGCATARSCAGCAAGCVARGTPAYDALRAMTDEDAGDKKAPPGVGEKDPAAR